MTIIITLYSIAVTVTVYLLSLKVTRKYPTPFTTPVFLSTVAIILILLVSHISYQNYQIAKDIMSYFLGPATVALAIPLYKNRTMMLKYLTPILFGMIVGSTVTISSAVILAKLLHLSQHVLAALTIKSITVPVASEVAKNIGANQVLVAGFVMFSIVGIKSTSIIKILSSA